MYDLMMYICHIYTGLAMAFNFELYCILDAFVYVTYVE